MTSSVNITTQKKSSSLLSQKLNRMLSYHKGSQKPKSNERPGNAIFSPLKQTLNHTSYSVHHRSLESNDSEYLRRKIINTPKVSNYSEDLNTMMESYFTKKLKQIRTNIAELHQKEKEKGLHEKKNPQIKNFVPNKKTDSKSLLNVIDKKETTQTESLNNSNILTQNKELNENRNESGRREIKKTKNLTQKTFCNAQPKQHHINDKGKNKELISSIKERQKQEAVKERREKLMQKKKDSVNGIKCEYYADNSCVHRIFINNDDMKSIKKINQSLKELFSVVFRKEIDVNISIKTNISNSKINIPESEDAVTPDQKNDIINIEGKIKRKEHCKLIKGKEAKRNYGNNIKLKKLHQKEKVIESNSKEKFKTKRSIITDLNIIPDDHFNLLKSDYDLLSENIFQNEVNTCNTVSNYNQIKNEIEEKKGKKNKEKS